MIAAIIYGLIAIGAVLAVFFESCRYIAIDDKIGACLMAICTIAGIGILSSLAKDAIMFYT